MSYTKQTWQAGDEITSAKLNHLEDGINNVATEVANFPVEVNNPQDGDTLIYNAAEQKWVSGSNSSGSGGGFLKVGIDIQTRALDKTWKQIYDAMSVGYYVNVVNHIADEGEEEVVHSYVYQCLNDGENGYIVKIYSVASDGTTTRILVGQFVTGSEDGFPVLVQD